MHRPSRFLLLSSVLFTLAACKPATPPAETAAGEPAAAATPAATEAPSPTPTPSVLAKAVSALNPLQDPKAAVTSSIQSFLGVRSYHAVMRMEGGPRGSMDNQIDFVAPDRYRMSLDGMGNQVIIGDTMYMDVQGRSMKVPMPAGSLSKWRDPAKLAENEAGMTVQAQGSDPVDGAPARRYLVHHAQPQPTDVTLWIGGDNLPLQMQVRSDVHGKPMATTIRYSRYNDPTLSIEPPR